MCGPSPAASKPSPILFSSVFLRDWGMIWIPHPMALRRWGSGGGDLNFCCLRGGGVHAADEGDGCTLLTAAERAEKSKWIPISRKDEKIQLSKQRHGTQDTGSPKNTKTTQPACSPCLHKYCCGSIFVFLPPSSLSPCLRRVLRLCYWAESS